MSKRKLDTYYDLPLDKYLYYVMYHIDFDKFLKAKFTKKKTPYIWTDGMAVKIKGNHIDRVVVRLHNDYDVDMSKVQAIPVGKNGLPVFDEAVNFVENME